ncbi:MAG: LamG domain-containing protein, partial [Bacteroidales bacterium]|nr:LamG domain-containing protein [Bacteroidales bacterium]
SIPNPAAYNFQSGFTISAMVKPTAFNRQKTFLSKVTPNRDFVLQYYDSTPNVHFAQVSPLQYFLTPKSNIGVLNKYTCFTATWDGSDLVLYVDGIHAATQNFSGYAPKWTGGYLCIGNLYPGSREGFVGCIKNVRFYNRSLNATEVMQLNSQ